MKRRLAPEFFGESMRKGFPPKYIRELGTYKEYCDPDNENIYIVRLVADGTNMVIFDKNKRLLHYEGLVPVMEFKLLEHTADMTDYYAVYGMPHFDIGSGRNIPAYICSDYSLIFLAGKDDKNVLHFRRMNLKNDKVTDL